MANLELNIPSSELIKVHPDRIHQIVDSALPFYKDDGTMLFHGLEHPYAVTNSFLNEWVTCAENGYETDLEAGVGATAHHDDDFHVPLKDSGYEYKETRSADIAEPILIELHFNSKQIVLSRGGIEATRAGVKCKNLLEKQVVRSDLANTGMPYLKFLKFFIRLSKEQRYLTGAFSSFNEVKDVTIDKLTTYFDQDLRYPFEKVCPLSVRGIANLARLKRDDEATVSAITGEDF